MGRVAIVNNIAGVGPLQVKALKQAGWQADFYDLPKPAASWPVWAKLLTLPLRLLLYVPVVLRLRRRRYDIVHVHFVSQGIVGAASGRPYVLHAHGSDLHLNLQNPLMRWWSTRWLRGARAIFYVTPNLAPFLTEYEDKARLLPNPVDVAQFAGAHAPENLVNVLIFMRLLPVKGPEVVFDVAAELSKLVSLTAIDAGPLAADYLQRHAGDVSFIRPVSHGEVPRLLSEFDAVIGQMRQGVPGLSELEALAAGRIVFMSLDDSLYERDRPPVIDVATGPELVERIGELRGATAQLRMRSDAGRQWVERHHSLDSHAEALIHAYRTALAEAR